MDAIKNIDPSMRLISILMPAYNSEQFIAASIQSVLMQTYHNWELLIINDGSSDNTQQIAELYSSNDSRIKVLNQENKKQAAARNNGILHAQGVWIAFLDADDLWEPDKLSKQIQASIDFPTVNVFYTDGWIFKGEDFSNLEPYPTTTGKLIEFKDMYAMQYESNYIPILSVLVKRTLVDEIGLQDERKMFSGCEDWDYWLRMIRAGASFYGLPERLFYYRRHNNNVSGNILNMIMARTAVFIKNFELDYFVNGSPTSFFKKQIFENKNLCNQST